MLSETFATRLKRLRERAGYSQAELARRAGLAQSTVLRYEAGEREPLLSQLRALATALDCRVADLTG